LPNPRSCQILEAAKSSNLPLANPRGHQILEVPDPGRRHILDAAKSLTLPNSGYHLILAVAKSSKSSNPHEHMQKEQNLRQKKLEAVRGFIIT